MKIQTLGIIFIIIILPISFALSLYTKSQLETLSLQNTYDAKLQQSTYDALQAFQINTENNTESNIADSKLKDIEASINAFFNSLEANFELNGYSLNQLKEYVPGIVYTMYDGYYIYSPYSNVATTTETGVVVNEDESENVQYGLKPYIYYNCRYKRAGDDFVITYSLDNYITIKGIIGGKYINDSGYIISNIEPYGDGSYKYNGIVIEPETGLEEYVGNTKYKYIKISGTKYYWDEAKNRVFYILNGNIHEQISKGTNEELYNKYVNIITNNSSALRYYKEAYEFTDRVLNKYNLKNLNVTDAYDAEGNRIKFATNSYTKIFKQDDVKENIPLEYSTSNFNKHRKEVIRYAIESNLSMAIANFNRYSQNTAYNYQMPELKETDWDMLASNVSIISFLQGLSIGGKIYNGYSVVLNTETQELVREQDIYIVGKDEHYHRIEDKYLLEYKTLGDYVDKSSYSKGALDLDFKLTSANGANNSKVYYYPKRELACYDCVVNQLGLNYDFEYSSIYEYLNKLNVNTQTTLLKKVYYTALGRERWGSKLNNVKIESLDDIHIDNEFESNEITIDFNPKEWTNKPVNVSVKFAESINLDKVVIEIASPPYLQAVEYQTLLKFENGSFTDIKNNPMTYEVTENSIIYVVAYSKSGKKIIKYDIVNWIDKEKPVIQNMKIEEISDSGIREKIYNSIEEWNNKGYTWTKNDVVQIINATDESGIDRIEYTYNNGATVQALPEAIGGTWLINYSFNQNIRVRAVDKAGNAGDWTSPYSICIDKEKPSNLNIDLRDETGAVYTNGALTNKTITLTASARDNYSGIAKYQYSYNRSTVHGEFASQLTINATVNQVYFIRAVDNVGNVGEWSEGYRINVDKTAPKKPMVTLKYNNEGGALYPNYGPITNQNVWQQAYSEDSDIARYEFSNDKYTIIGGTSNPWTIAWSTANKQPFYVRAIDEAGNPGEWSDVYYIWIDKDPPGYSGSLTATTQNINQVRLDLTLNNASEIAKIDIKYRVAGANYDTRTVTSGISNNYSYTLTDLEYSTQYEMYMILYDTAGNTTETNHVNPKTGIRTNTLTGSVQNKNQIVLELKIDDIDKIQRVEVKYKTANEATYTTISASKATDFRHTLNLNYLTTYNIYIVLYDNVGNNKGTNIITLTTEPDHTHTADCYHYHKQECYHKHSAQGPCRRWEVWNNYCGNCKQGPNAHYDGNPYGACNNFQAWEGWVLRCDKDGNIECGLSDGQKICGYP